MCPSSCCKFTLSYYPEDQYRRLDRLENFRCQKKSLVVHGGNTIVYCPIHSFEVRKSRGKILHGRFGASLVDSCHAEIVSEYTGCTA
jgi:hypothetical protein